MRNRVVFGLALSLAVPALAFAQANVAGKWTGEVQGGRGPTPVTLELTVTGTTVAGKLTQGQGMPVDIQNAKLEGNKLTFSAPGGGGGGGRGGGGGGGGGAAGGGAPPAGWRSSGWRLRLRLLAVLRLVAVVAAVAVVAVAVVEVSSTTPRQSPAPK